MSAKKSLKSMLKEGKQIFAPCVYDCLSARAAEVCGYEAMTLSSCEMIYAMSGVPDGVMNYEELFYGASRIAKFSELPLIADAENGGGTPLNVYRNCKRLAEAGCMGITIEDTTNFFFAGYHHGEGGAFMDVKQWATNIYAAVDAVKGTDCIIIARTDCKGTTNPEMQHKGKDYSLGLEEAIRRANMGIEAGAHMTMVQNIDEPDCGASARKVAKHVPGWKFYPDIKAKNGIPDISFKELEEMGYNIISCHQFMKGATKGMLEYGYANIKNKNTVYTENDEFYGLGHVFHPFIFHDWIDKNKMYNDYLNKLLNK